MRAIISTGILHAVCETEAVVAIYQITAPLSRNRYEVSLAQGALRRTQRNLLVAS